MSEPQKEAVSEEPDGPVMYYLINKDIKQMKEGKLCAQIGHATVMICLGLKDNPVNKRWLATGQPKITLKSNTEEMELLYTKYCRSKKYKCVKVVDAGKTQIPAGSFTVLAFEPHMKREMKDDIKEIAQGKLY